MNGNNSFLLVDTNIILYYLNGDKRLAEVLDGNHLVVSFITELEILSYKNFSKLEHQRVISFLENECVIVDINNSIKLETIDIRTNYQLKLPDAIIAATALSMNIPLLSADKGFKKLKKLDVYFYEIL